jgi:branched-chain amino acid transport system substrate-binding protein
MCVKKTWRSAVAAIVGLGLAATACGSSDSGSSSAETTAGATTAAPVTTGAATTAAAGGATTAAATTVASGVKYGKQADGTYLGKGDLKLDLKNCPSDWNVDQGITADEVKIFSSMPKSGPLAGFGLIADGANSYFKLLNDKGGVAGKKIVYEVKDDTYQADKTKANVDEAIAANAYAALVTVIGTPNNLAIWDTTHKECMPQLLNGTGAAQWGDVENHPWTTGMQLDYTTEAILWSEWIKTEYPNGAKVASVTFNNDFGKSYAKGFKTAIKGTNIELVLDELHEANAPNLTNQFTNIESKKPDVILIQTSGAFCTQAMAEIEKRALTAKVMMSGTCGSLSQFFKPLLDQGLTGKDTHIIQTFKDVNDPEFANDEFVKLFKDTLAKQGLDNTQSTYATGWIFAWFMVEILKEASTYEGGLDRANMMLAARGIDKVMPLSLEGITNKMDGVNDAYLVEGGRVAKYTVTDPKALGSFVKVSDVINNEGKLGTYEKFQAIAGE